MVQRLRQSTRVVLAFFACLWVTQAAGAAPAAAAPVPAAQEAPLQILAVEEPPVSFSGADGRPEGYAIDVLREIQRRVGDATPAFIEPESRVYASGLRQPNVVMLSFSRTAEREASFHWIARIARKPWVFYGRQDGPLVLRSLDDVRKLRAVGVVTGDVRTQWLQSQGLRNLVLAENHEQVLRLLQAGRVDAVFAEPQGIAYYCRGNRCGGKVPRALWAPRVSDVYILMSKRGTPAETARRWQAAAAAAIADGTVEAIAKRWAVEAERRFGVRSEVRRGILDFCTGGVSGC